MVIVLLLLVVSHLLESYGDRVLLLLVVSHLPESMVRECCC